MSSNFCYIMPKNSLAKDIRIQKLVLQIMDKIVEIPFYTEYKGNMELLKMVCVMIEHAIDNSNKKDKIDKKDIVFQVYNKVYAGMKPQDLKDLEANINYLHENLQIKKKTTWSVIKHSVCDWFNRKVIN